MSDPFDFAVITAIVLAVVQGAGPWIRSILQGHARKVRSFGGGVGLAYVFLQLFPEIDNVNEWMGTHVHQVTLVSFLLFYAVEVRLFAHGDEAAPDTDDVTRPVFWLHIGILFFYTAMVMFTLPDEVADDLLFATVGGMTIGVHLVYKDYLLRSHADRQMREAGRYILVLAPLLGWLAHSVTTPSEMVLDLFMAVLAGVLIQSVFRDEVPNPGGASMRWLVAGVATFALLSFIGS